jgi:hypothetical protein
MLPETARQWFRTRAPWWLWDRLPPKLLMELTVEQYVRKEFNFGGREPLRRFDWVITRKCTSTRVICPALGYRRAAILAH